MNFTFALRPSWSFTFAAALVNAVLNAAVISRTNFASWLRLSPFT